MNKRYRIKIIVTGFFVFFIPLIYLCVQLNNLYKSQKEESRIDLKKEIFSVSKKLKDNLIPYNYLQLECSKIHKKLFPDFQKEITSKIIEDSYAEKLYTKETLNKIVSFTQEKFPPIIITLGTNKLKGFYAYYSPELEMQIENNNDKRNLLISMNYLDIQILLDIYEKYYKNPIDIQPYYNIIEKEKINPDKYCYKYISRYHKYSLKDTKIYTDYFNKQILYNINKYSFSKKGIHGYYSIIIPQSSIDPGKIIKSALENNHSEVKIELMKKEREEQKKEKEEEESELIDIKTGYEYYFDFPTEYINQIRTYKWLTNKDKTYLLAKRFKLSIEYPNKIKEYEYLNIGFQFFTLLSAFVYICISILFLQKNNLLQGYERTLAINKIINYCFNNIKVTQKLILILSIIIFIPIIGIGLFIWISSQNFNNLIDYNVSKNLSNEINNIYLKNQENDQRSLVSTLELKRKIKKSAFYPQMNSLTDKILPKKDESTWFRNWNTKLTAISDDGIYYSFRNGKGRQNEKEYNDDGVYLRQYAKNLGILKKDSDDIRNDFSLSLALLEKYVPLSKKEQSVGQESVPHRNVVSLTDTYLGTYLYAIDSKHHEYLLLNFKWRIYLTYNYLTALKPKNNIPWYNPQNKYSDINIGVAISQEHKIGDIDNYPFSQNEPNNVNEITKNALANKDSGREIIKSSHGSLIKQWIFTDNNPFIIGGEAKSNYNTMLQLSIYMIFPLLMSYAILLLILFMGFISFFIKQPISIYNEGISALENSSYGTTIESFSKDEFDHVTKAFNEMSEAIKQKYLISRYVSDKLIQSVTQNKIQEAGTGKQEKVTILTSDIRNFTGISEKNEPSVIVEMLNTYFTKMQKVINDNGGIIDKYIGDAVQAVFYDEPDKENQVIRAARAALAMRKALDELNKERVENGLFTIENGIGIDTDIAITGTIGTEKGRKDFSVNGDVVARATNLEAKTKLTASKILISKKSLDWIATASLKPRNDGLVYEEFDSESVELIDVRE